MHGGYWLVRLCIPGETRFEESFADEVAAGKKYDAVVSAAYRGGGLEILQDPS